MTRNRFVLLAAAVVVVAFAVGLAIGLASGSSGAGGTAAAAPSTSPSPSATPGPALPTALVRDCAPAGEGMSCVPVTAGVDEVLVKQWPDAASMQADFARTQGGEPDGKCGSYTGTPTSGMRSTWGGGRPLACYVNSNGAAVVLWEVPDKRLELLAIRKDGNTKAAFSWWNQAVKIAL